MPRMEITRNNVSHRDVKTGAPRPRGQYTIGLCVRGNAGLSPPAAESGQARQGMAGQFPRHPSSVVGMVPAGRRAKVRTPKWWRGGHRSVVGETAVWRPGKGRRRPGIFSGGSFERCGGGVVHHQKFIKNYLSLIWLWLVPKPTVIIVKFSPHQFPPKASCSFLEDYLDHPIRTASVRHPSWAR